MILFGQAIALLLVSLLGLANQTRRAIKAGLTLFLYWNLFYIGIHVLIAAYDGSWMSPLHIWWTLLFTFGNAYLLWHFGGVIIDSELFAELLGMPIGQKLTHIFKQIYWVWTVIGMFFYLFPVSGSWTLLGALSLFVFGALITGSKLSDEKKNELFRQGGLICLILMLLLALFPNTKFTLQAALATLTNKAQQRWSSADRTREQLVDITQDKFTPKLENVIERYKKGEISAKQAGAYLESLENSKKAELEAFATAQTPSNPPPSPSDNRLPTPAASVTKLGDNAYRVTVPGNQEFHTGIKAPAGWFMEFTQHSGQVKLHPGDTYTNPPEGGFETDKVRDTKDPNARLVWVLQPGRTGALLARFNDSPYHDVGGHKGTRVQAPADGELLLSVNYLVDGRNFVSGGFQVTVRVTKD